MNVRTGLRAKVRKRRGAWRVVVELGGVEVPGQMNFAWPSWDAAMRYAELLVYPAR